MKNTSRKPWNCPFSDEELANLHVSQRKTMGEIAAMGEAINGILVDDQTVANRMKKLGIPVTQKNRILLMKEADPEAFRKYQTRLGHKAGITHKEQWANGERTNSHVNTPEWRESMASAWETTPAKLIKRETRECCNPDCAKPITRRPCNFTGFPTWYCCKGCRNHHLATLDRENPVIVHRRLKAKIHKNQITRIIRQTREADNGGCFTAEQWLTLCEKYGHKCLACGKVKKLTVDHIIPVSKGGTSYISNIQPLCGSCNSSKGTLTIDYRYLED